MNVEEVAALLKGVSEALRDSIKTSASQELASLAELLGSFEGKSVREFTGFIESMHLLLRRYPGGSTKEFVAFVEKAFSAEKNSVPALIERMSAIKAGSGEPLAELQAILKKLPAASLKSVAKAIGVAAGRTKNDTMAALQSWLSDTSQSHSPLKPETSLDQADHAYRRIREIESRLATLSVEDIRSQFEQVQGLSKPVLEQVATRMGYSSIAGSRDEIARQLLSILVRKKTSQVQTSLIGQPQQ